MTRFIDGPAQGHVLSLARAPHFLRVVVNRAGVVDGLDQLDDTPEAGEKLYAYEVVGEVGRCHVYRRGKGAGPSGWFAIANYKLCEKQPTDEEMRTTERWHEWALLQTRNQEPRTANAP